MKFQSWFVILFILIVSLLLFSIFIYYLIVSPNKTNKNTLLTDPSYCPLTNCGTSGLLFKTRSRSEAKYGGKDCKINSIDCPGGTLNDNGTVCTIPCSTTPCPQDCIFGTWGDLSNCSVKCGGGYKIKKREIIQEAKYGGKCIPKQSDCKSDNPHEFSVISPDGKSCTIYGCNPGRC